MPDSNIANPAAINITKNPHTKNKNVLNIKPTSAETVVSAELGNARVINNKRVVKNLNFFIINHLIDIFLVKKRYLRIAVMHFLNNSFLKFSYFH